MTPVRVQAGDAAELIKALDDASVDAVVTDPPYGLAFMGKAWDHGATAFAPAFWSEVSRVLKPGGHVVAFGGTRTGHRLAVALEDAGFEVRDCLGWVFGAGFPKSLNVSRALEGSLPADALCACERGYPQKALGSQSGYQSCHGSDDGQPLAGREGDQDALPSQGDAPAHSRSGQPRDGLAAIQANNGLDVGTGPRAISSSLRPSGRPEADSRQNDNILSDTAGSTSHGGLRAEHKTASRRSRTQHSGGGSEVSSSRNPNLSPCEHCGKLRVQPGLGTALKPAWELIYLCRKPLSEKTVAENVLAHGTGALNIDGTRTRPGEIVQGGGRSARGNGGVYGDGIAPEPAQPHALGRWPANVVHDGSDEVVAAFPATTSGARKAGEHQPLGMYANAIGEAGRRPKGMERRLPALEGDTGSAARFYYSAKADEDDRLGSRHPTIKPVALMQWLIRLVTPKGGVVLDPFAGTGTTGEAAMREGCSAILIEREPDYLADIDRRLAAALSGPETRRHAILKAKGKVDDPGPLFAWGLEAAE